MENKRNIIIVGIIGSILLLAAIFIFNKIRNIPAVNPDLNLMAEFASISSLKSGASVYYNGYIVGSVDDIYLKKGNSKKKVIVVAFNVNRDFRVPAHAEAVAYVPNPLYEARLELRFDSLERAYTDEDWLQDGDVIPGRAASYLTDVRDQIAPYADKADSIIMAAFPGKENLKQLIKDTESSIGKVKTNTFAFKRSMIDNQKDILEMVVYINQVMAAVDNRADTINDMITFASKTTGDIRKVNIQQYIPKIHPDSFPLPDVNAIDKNIIKYQQLLEKMNNPQDTTYAWLFSDEEYAIKVKDQLDKLKNTISKIKAHPERYLSNKGN